MMKRNQYVFLVSSLLLIMVIAATFFVPRLLTHADTASPGITVQPQVAGSCGITKTNNGYSFQWLHTANGVVMASSGCTINLRGFNLAGTGFGSAFGNRAKRLSNDTAWYAKTFKMNVWRVFLNAVWWNNDVYVPDAGMHYQAWIQHVVTVLESNGNYVLLTKGPQFHELPCSGSGASCPPQNQAQIDINKNPNNVTYQHQLTTGEYIDDAVTMWKSVAKLYANDPAVIYDSWNEMHAITDQLWRKNSAILIDTIQANNPRALVFVGGSHYENGIGGLIKGTVPAFTEKNLVFDFHVYNGYVGNFQGQQCNEPDNTLWVSWPSNANEQVSYAQKHGAASFSEWGGCNDAEPYNSDMTSFAIAHHVLLAYYDLDQVVNLTGNDTLQLNSNGTKVQADYAKMG